ncbi:MAG: DUF6178 family protein [Candidatus Tectimicrobiota bacterium]
MSDAADYRQVLLTPHPFWTTLSPTTVRQRIEHMLAVPGGAALVQDLSPIEYAVLLKAAPEMRPALLQMGQAEQIRTVLDLDCWQKDALQSTRVLEWLEDLQRSGEENFTQVVETLDSELLVLTLHRHLRVHAALPAEEEEEPRLYDEVLSNELYTVEFVEPDSPLNERLTALLQFIRLTDLDLYHQLMQEVMWAQDSELEEWAYRWKTGRLQDESIPEYHEALAAFHVLDATQFAPLPADSVVSPGRPASAEETGLVPTYAWGLTRSASPLQQVLHDDIPQATLERLCWEMVALCNKALVFDQVDFADTMAVRTTLERVQAYINIGLEYLSASQHESMATLLATHALLPICQVGFSLSMHLRQRALRLQKSLHCSAGIRRALSGLAQHVLHGLLQTWHPQFFLGLAFPGDLTYHDFTSLQELYLVESVLQALEHDPAYQGMPRASSTVTGEL